MAKIPQHKRQKAVKIRAPLRAPVTMVVDWRQTLNRTPPSVAMAVDVTASGFETKAFLDAPAPGAIRINLNGKSREITAANIASTLSNRDVAGAAAELIDVAAGRSSEDVHYLCSIITNAVFSQAGRYPLNRPDLRYREEGGWVVA